MANRSRLDAVNPNPLRLTSSGGIQISSPAVPGEHGRFADSHGWTKKLGFLTDSTLKNPTRICGAPGSGKTRLLGRIIAWQALVRNQPQVILTPPAL